MENRGTLETVDYSRRALSSVSADIAKEVYPRACRGDSNEKIQEDLNREGYRASIETIVKVRECLEL